MRRCLCGLVGLPSCDHYLSFRNPIRIGQSQSPPIACRMNHRMSMYHDFLVPFSCGSSAWRRSFHALTLAPKPRRRVRDLRVASRSLRARVSSYHRHSELHTVRRQERSLDGSLVPRRLGSCLLCAPSFRPFARFSQRSAAPLSALSACAPLSAALSALCLYVPV